MTKKDTLFTQENTKQFEFDDTVVEVFDDMVIRSVPFYKEVVRLCVDFAIEFYQQQSVILDLGSATGTLLLEIAKNANVPISLVGIDSSLAMIEKAKEKFKSNNMSAKFICADMLEATFPSSSVIIANYTLQFVRPPMRIDLVEKIFQSLQNGGIFICSEKVTHSNRLLDFKMMQSYYAYKKQQGYSQLEISNKREALENVLIPYTDKENRDMFLKVGFKEVAIVFCWVNFITYIAIK